ncbi:MAG: type II toxin-antitoxin system PemK/MazF family toxin [Patescibacteria group bacterium]
MKKDFDRWNDNKKRIHSEKNNKQYHARDILSANTCLVIPLTSSTDKHPMRVPIGIVDGKEASAILSQIRTVDTKRFLGKICYLNVEVFDAIRKAIKEIL